MSTAIDEVVTSEPDNSKFVRLKELTLLHGKLTPEIALIDAEDPASPLHGAVEWEDTLAANEHRLNQMRQLIGRYRVKVVKREKVSKVKAFIYEPEASAYYLAEDVAKDAERWDAHVERVYQRLLNLRADMDALEVFEGVANAIDSLPPPSPPPRSNKLKVRN